MTKRAVTSIALRNKKVFVVTGLRRSGNHALIKWMSNALEEGHTPITNRIDSFVYKTKSGRTLHFNEVNFYGYRKFLKALLQTRNSLDRASNIIISLEDYIPKSIDPYVPVHANLIAVKRSTLNLIASRIQRAISQAQKGLDRGDMAIKEGTLDYLYWTKTSHEGNWQVWDFDRWIDDNEYRKHFLKHFGLSSDIPPDISELGDGSSFTGRNLTPSSEKLTERWRQIEWPDRVLRLLSKVNDPWVLSDAEIEFVTTELNIVKPQVDIQDMQ